MLQCRLCGCNFDERTVGPCNQKCGFGDCHGTNVLCPNCGHDVPVPKELRQQDFDEKSFLENLKKLFHK